MMRLTQIVEERADDEGHDKVAEKLSEGEGGICLESPKATLEA